MKIYDQLGEVRYGSYVSRYHSAGIDDKSDTDEPRRVLRTQATEAEHNGEDVILVKAEVGATLGEAALFAAFVQHKTGEAVICHCNDMSLELSDLPFTASPYMSDAEVEQRFDAIEGIGPLAEHEKRQIADLALLLTTHFNRRLKQPSAAPDASLKFEDRVNPPEDQS